MNVLYSYATVHEFRRNVTERRRARLITTVTTRFARRPGKCRRDRMTYVTDDSDMRQMMVVSHRAICDMLRRLRVGASSLARLWAEFELICGCDRPTSASVPAASLVENCNFSCCFLRASIVNLRRQHRQVSRLTNYGNVNVPL